MIRLLRLAFKVALALLGVVVLYVAVTFVQVWWTGRQDQATGPTSPPSGAIVVLGAAQWNGSPSPVLAARLDHAVELYQKGVASTIIVTGGKQAGDRVTQGRAGYDYLRKKGVPDKAIKVEVDGTNTFEELSAAALIMRNAGLGDHVVLVSDPYHLARAEGIAGEVGLSAVGSPADTPSSASQYAKETLAVGLGRFVGYGRLSRL